MAIVIPPEVLSQLYLLIAAIIAAAIAWLQKIGKDEAQQETFEAKAETAQVQAFFDPDTGNVPVPASVPARAWKMNEETKGFLTKCMSAADAAIALQQVAEAEAAGKTDYYIDTSAGYYHINFGIIMGSGGSGKGV